MQRLRHRVQERARGALGREPPPLRELLRAAGLGATDRFFGALFGIARGLAVAFVVVLIGGLAGVSKEPWWRDALFSAPLESAVIAAKPWLPAEVADKIRFR